MIDKYIYKFFCGIDNLIEGLDKFFQKLHNTCYERFKDIGKLFKKSKRRKSKKNSF